MYKYKISFSTSVETGFLFYKRNCPPISRILYLVLRRVARCPSFIYVRHHWRTLSAYPPSPASSGLFRPKKIKPQRLGLFGISTHKVYPPLALLRNAVRSYRTFSPLLIGYWLLVYWLLVIGYWYIGYWYIGYRRKPITNN